MFKIQYSPRSLKSLKSIPKKAQEKIIKVIEGLKSKPFSGKKLQGPLAGFYSLRIWPYRIIYIVKKKEVMIIIFDIGHRQNIYK